MPAASSPKYVRFVLSWLNIEVAVKKKQMLYERNTTQL